jgi:endonuclease G
VEGNRKKILNYTNLSVLYHADRRVPFLSAYNIDGGKKMSGIKRASSFKPDPRIEEAIQLSQKGFYDLKKDITEFEIGHMAANNEMAWGDDAQLKAYQTFHFPNSVPQAERLNTGIWKALESYIVDEATTLRNKKICVFTGPLLRDDDPAYVADPNFQIPLLFYKVIIFPTSRGLRSTAFMMSHERKMEEDNLFLLSRLEGPFRPLEAAKKPFFKDFKYRKVFQVNIKYLEEHTGLNFTWKDVRHVKVPDDKQQVMKIRKVSDAGDAAAASKALEKGRFLERMLSDKDLTSSEMKHKNYKLSMILR